jgi:sugar phosphate permease
MPSPIAAVPRRARLAAFGLSWLAYATYYLGRKGFSVSKASIQDELGLDPSALGAIDTAYLAAYMVGQFASGWLGDRIGPRRLIGFGMIGSALACATFGLGTAFLPLFAAFMVNGLLQATGWPGTTKVMAAWTTKRERGAVMGAWSTCYQVGGIVATALATRAMVAWGWRYALFVPAAALAVVGLVELIFLPEKPPTPLEPDAAPDEANEDAALREERRRVLRSPLLWSYGASYFSIKLIRYSLLFWTGYYFEKVLHFDNGTANYLSTSFEIGGVLGAIALGALSDRLPRVPRATLSFTSLVLLAVALLGFRALGNVGAVPLFAAMALVGALLFGPDALMSGAATQDLGGTRAVSTATGFVNGVGSMGAILQAYVTVEVSKRFGWGAVFAVFVGFALLAAAALVPAILRRREPTT